TFSLTGGDTDVSGVFTPKGTGSFYFGNGLTNASPSAGLINGTGGSGTNIAGANLNLAGGRGTGNSSPGLVAVRYPLQTTSGTTLQSLSSNSYPVATTMFTATSTATVSNTTSETTILGSGTGTKTIEAGAVRAGRTYSIKL